MGQQNAGVKTICFQFSADSAAFKKSLRGWAHVIFSSLATVGYWVSRWKPVKILICHNPSRQKSVTEKDNALVLHLLIIFTPRVSPFTYTEVIGFSQ